MNPEIAEELLHAVMGEVRDADFPNQLGVLRDLAAYKYDDYSQYAPARQFIAYLAGWLNQFGDGDERRDALRYIHQRLIYISNNEMRHLVSLMAEDRVPTTLHHHVARDLPIPAYHVNKVRAAPKFARAKQASLFLGMSDGARIGQLRRANTGLSNEQFGMTYELNGSRAKSMLCELRKRVADDEPRDEDAFFEYIFLVDDFAGSGRTIIRQEEDGKLTGRLVRFIDDTLCLLKGERCPKIYIALYVATPQALNHLKCAIANYPNPPWTKDNTPEIISVMMIGDHAKLVCGRGGVEYEADRLFDRLLHKYYDQSVEDEHKRNVKHGYSQCGLPLILAHNTPNNSVYLLWESKFTEPLFPRYERH